MVLSLEHYQSVGGFSEALSSHADEALAELKDVREQRIAERIFKRLTTREEGERDTRDPTTLRELVAITEAPADEVIRVINVFSQPGRSFLTPYLESSPSAVLDTMIDISHESLIRQWGTLKKWVIDEAKSADTYLRLEETARLYRAKNADPYRGLDLQGALHWRKTEKPTDAWAKRYGAKRKETEAFGGAIAFLEESERNWGREQASQARRRRIAFFSVATWPVMLMFIIAAFYMWQLWHRAEAEQNKAVALKLVAEGQLAEFRHSDQLQLHALLAIESTKRFPSPLANQSLSHALDLMPRPLTTMLHQDWVSAVSFSPDGKTLASGSRDNNVWLWDLATGKELHRLSHKANVNAVSFSPNGKTLASGSEDKTVRVWDLATGKEQQRWSHEDTVTTVSFSPDGKTLASGSGDNTVRVWDLATGKEQQRFSHDSIVYAVSFSPDGKHLASGSQDNTVRVWDLGTGKELQRLAHASDVNAVSFSPNGKTLASGSKDETVRVWDLGIGKELQRWSHKANVNAVSFSPDGKTLASGSWDKTVWVWDLATGKEQQRWSHENWVTAVTFSPDGKHLASGSYDNTVRLWPWQPQDWMLAVCERSARNLRWDEWRLYFEDQIYTKTCEHLPVHESVIDHAQQLAESGNVAEATALFQRISEIEPSATLDPIAEADRRERKGKLEKIWASFEKLRAEKQYAEWIEMTSEVVQLDPTAVPNKDWNNVCWDGALGGQALAVMRACDLAVERAGSNDPIHVSATVAGSLVR